jgi:hypothetical protein
MGLKRYSTRRYKLDGEQSVVLGTRLSNRRWRHLNHLTDTDSSSIIALAVI